MAIRCFYPHKIFPRGQTRKTMMRTSLTCNNQISPRASVPLGKSCMVNNKVYEDQVLGIICYRDERGEIICEGTDEGPRYSHHSSSRNGEKTCTEGYNKRPRYSHRAPAWIKAGLTCEEYEEDRVQDVICYRDGTGEIICEGYDEGPRHSHKSPSQKADGFIRHSINLVSINQL